MQYPSPAPATAPSSWSPRTTPTPSRTGRTTGDAVIGIHGPITSYDDSLIGTTGAAISHGCIRLHEADLAQLSIIPPGTPIDIID